MSSINSQDLQSRFFQVMHRFKRINWTTEQMMKEGLTRGEFFCITLLLDHRRENPDAKGMYVWELAAHMKVSPPGASRALKGMEGKGFIERIVDREDRRNTYIRVTTAGEDAWNNTGRQIKEQMDRILSRMGEENVETFLSLWNRLLDIIEDEQAKENQLC